MSKIKKHVDDEYFRQIYFDGATQLTNPGQAACGAVLEILNGESMNLQPLYEKVLNLLHQFDFYVIKWIPRHENQRADAVASSVLSPIQHQSLMLLDLPAALPTVASRKGLEA